MAAGPGSAALTASSSSPSSSSSPERWMEVAESEMGGDECVRRAGGAGVSERINGSHYMVLTVWPGRGVMDVL